MRCPRHGIEPAHLPGIDPGAKRLGFDAGLADAAARKGFAEAMGVGAGHRGVAHPDLLIGPAFAVRRRLRSPAETASTARHRRRRWHRRDWRSRTTIRCEIPDAGRDRRETQMSCRERRLQIRFALSPSPAKPCAKRRWPAEPEPRSAPPTKPRRVIGPLALIGKDLDQAGRLHARQPEHGKQRRAAAPPPSRRRAAQAIAAGRHETAAASRTLSH